MAIQQLLASYAEASAPGLSATWDSAQKSVPAVLSAGDLRLTANTGVSGTYANTRSTRGLQGLAYISAEIGTAAAGAVYGFGVADATWNVTSASVYCGGSGSTSVGLWGPNGATYFNNSVIFSGGTGSAPANVEIAVRVATRRVWIRRSGGAWLGGGDPAADTSPTATLSGSGVIYAAASVTRSGALSTWFVELDPNAAATTGTVPTGFTAANWIP